MLENIRLSFQGIWSHKMRSLLTMLGIIIGIASIISIVSTIQGTNKQLEESLLGAGNNAVNVKLFRSDSEYVFDDYTAPPSGVPVFTEQIRQEMLDVSGVEDISFYNSRDYSYNIFYLENSFTGAVRGIDQHYFNTMGLEVRTGREFLDEDFENYRKVAILDQDAANTLFQDEDPLGKIIEISSEPYTVIGIVQQSDEYELTFENEEEYYSYMSDSNGVVYIPSADWGISYAYDEPQNIVIKAETTDDMATVGSQVRSIANSYLTVGENSDIQYRSDNLLEQIQERQQLNTASNQQLVWIAGISLLVGGIGVMNIMLVTVTERTSEIGLKKAIGAKKKRILAQFLTEAAVLTSLGGIIGVIAGYVMSQVISRMTGAPTAISVPAAVIAVLFSMVIGVIFGLLPSVKAANLNPIDALRHE